LFPDGCRVYKEHSNDPPKYDQYFNVY